MHGGVEFDHINLVFELGLSARKSEAKIESTYDLVNHHQSSGLGMFDTLGITKYVHTVSLVQTAVKSCAQALIDQFRVGVGAGFE